MDDLRVTDISVKEADPIQWYSVLKSDWYIVTATLSDGRTIKTEAGISRELVQDWPMCRVVMAEIVLKELREREAANG